MEITVTRRDMSRTSVAFLYFFTVIMSYYIVRAIRTGDFLACIGPEYKPWADIFVVIVMLPCLRFYHLLVDHFPRRAFLGVMQALLAFQLMAFGTIHLVSKAWLAHQLAFLADIFPALPRLSSFWGCLASYREVWLSAAFYVWVAVFNLFMVTMCWSAINDVFRVGAAKRRYGFIAAGGPLGGMAGGSLTAIFVKHLSPGGMLMLSAAFVLGCVALSQRLLLLSEGEPEPKIDLEVDAKSEEIAVKPTTEQIKYASSIAQVVAMAVFVATLFNYQFNVLAKAMVPDRTELTALFGSLDMALNMVALFASLLLTPWILRNWGPRVGLRVLPAVYLLACLVLTLVSPFWFLVVMGVLASGLTYSLNKASQEVLYVPAGKRLKYKSKSFIDTFLFRFAGALASIYILVILAVSSKPATFLYLSTVFVCIVWLYSITKLALQYERFSRAKTQIEEVER